MPEKTANNQKNELKEINECAFQRKTIFSPDPIKQAHEVIFSRKTTEKIHPNIYQDSY